MTCYGLHCESLHTTDSRCSECGAVVVPLASWEASLLTCWCGQTATVINHPTDGSRAHAACWDHAKETGYAHLPGHDGEPCPWCEASETQSDAGARGANAAADADPEFLPAATKALAVVRAWRQPFTVAEVRAVLEEQGVIVTRPAALGAVFKSAHHAGVIAPNGDFVPSPIKGQHGRPLRVWVAA